MDKKSRRAGAGQGRGDLATDMARFAHAQHHYPSTAIEHGTHGCNKTLINTRDEVGHGTRLDIEHGASHFDERGIIGLAFVR